MWYTPLSAVNMFHYHWLIKKLLCLWQGRIEPGGKSKQRDREKENGAGEKLAAAGEARRKDMAGTAGSSEQTAKLSLVSREVFFYDLVEDLVCAINLRFFSPIYAYNLKV
ncbi:hypothetical protein H671_2g6017 [Cricetulus griseus]|nr:hypothetical protein H671_2g6017 [Cricetulus griseus]